MSKSLARVMAWTGATRLIESIARRPGLLVLNYHRIGKPDESPFDRGVFDGTPESFDEQLGWLKRRFRVVSLGEALECVRRPERLRWPLVLITFDDGYAESYRVAVPILRSHSLTAVFLLATSFIGSGRIPWWDQIAWMVRHSSQEQLILEYPKRACFPLPGSREPVVQALLGYYKDPATRDPEAFLAGLRKASAAAPPERDGHLFMSWEDARSVAAQGMEIGSHTHSHRLLSKLKEAEQIEELTHSRDLICQHLGRAPRALAYPVGSLASFNSTTVRAARAAGYEAAFSYFGGVNLPGRLDPFNLLRNSVDFGTPLATFRLRLTLMMAAGKRVF